MLADQLTRRARQARALAAGAVLAAIAVLAAATLPAGVGQAATTSGPNLKSVSYRGYTFQIPRSWQVIDDAAHPGDCVRFDQHVVYLGAPGVNQACPSWLLGTTESLLIQAGPARAARSSVENPTARQISVTARRISLTATFDTDPTVIYRILASASLPAPVIRLPNPAQLAAYVPGHGRGGTPPQGLLTAGARQLSGAPGSPAGGQARQLPGGLGSGQLAARGSRPQLAAAAARRPLAQLPDLPAQVGNSIGLGFDSCAAPSAAYMRAWRRWSPYQAVGIYIGGADRACDQRNLTSWWVRTQAAAGWAFIPLYAGPQAAYGELTSPVSQGARAAADAVTQAERLGFGPRTPIYYDMEAYPAGQQGAALSFLSAWTRGLHRLGFVSGVYSSSQSAIADLARHYSSSGYTMPDVIYDALWNGAKNTADSVISGRQWANHQRLHQYSGNVRQTFGGDTIDIDQDYLNISLAEPGGTPQSTQAVSLPGGQVYVFYRGAGGSLWRTVYYPGSGWARPASMGGALSGAPAAVNVGARGIDVFYRGTGGRLWVVTNRGGNGWGRPQQLWMMGVLGSAPRAVAQANGVVDVFWKGSAESHLWHGQFSPGHGWSGPQGLGGHLSSSPSPVEAAPGTVAVFWRGADASLWWVKRGLDGGWRWPASLGMGPLGGPVHATAQADGAMEVFWKGRTPHHVWSALRGPGGYWTGPRSLGGRVGSAPWPVLANWSLRVLYQGQGRRLWALLRSGIRWSAPFRLRMGRLGSGPFAAAGQPGGPLDVFWKGRDGALWSASLAGNGGWSRPHSLGGRVN